MCYKLLLKGSSHPQYGIDNQSTARGSQDLSRHVLLITHGAQVVYDRCTQQITTPRFVFCLLHLTVVSRSTEDCIAHSPVFGAVTIDEMLELMSKVYRKLGEEILVRELRQVPPQPTLLERLADNRLFDPQHGQIPLGWGGGVCDGRRRNFSCLDERLDHLLIHDFPPGPTAGPLALSRSYYP